MNDELKTELAEAKKTISDLTKQLNEYNSKAYADQVKELTDKVAALEAQAAEDKKKAADKDEEAKDSLETMKKDKESADATIADLKQKLEASIAEVAVLQTEKRTQARVALALSKGAKEDEAAEFANKHASKSDEDFNDMLSYAEYKWTVKVEKPASTTASEVLESVTPPTPEVTITEPVVEFSISDIQEVIKAALKKEGK